MQKRTSGASRSSGSTATATPDKCIARVFGVIDKSPLQRGTGAVLCLADRFLAFDRENLIVPIWMI